MNYIRQLAEENAELLNERADIAEALSDLRQYLQSPKFQGEKKHWVNPQDILNRLPHIYPR